MHYCRLRKFFQEKIFAKLVSYLDEHFWILAKLVYLLYPLCNHNIRKNIVDEGFVNESSW